MSGKLHFTMGLPRSGKSTFCKTWMYEKPGRVVLSGDDFRMAIYDRRFQLVGEELVRASMITAARALVHAGHEVMIDETNTTYTSVRHILNIDKEAEAWIFMTDKDECIKRAINCGHDDLQPSIERMAENLSITMKKILNNEISISILNMIWGPECKAQLTQ